MFYDVAGALRRFYRFFRSAKMTAIIISALLLLFFSGLIIPQKIFFQSKAQYDVWKAGNPILSWIIEALRLNEVYVAPITIFFMSLFFLNLIVVISQRVPLILKKAFIIKSIPLIDAEAVKNDANTKSFIIPEDKAKEALSKIKVFLRKRLWSVIDGDSSNAFLAVKNRYSPIGFLFFHLSFLLCLTGGLLVMYTRFSGELILTEGQEFYADLRAFRKITRDPKIFKALPPVGIFLEKVVPRYERDKATDLTVRMKVRYENDVKDEIIKINEPVTRGAMSIMAQNIGVSPLFVLRADDGKEIAGGYFSLNVFDGEEDSFEFENMPYKLHVRFYPDYEKKNNKEYTLSKDIKNPFIHLTILQEGLVVYENTIGKGQGAKFDSMSVSFEDVRYWQGLKREFAVQDKLNISGQRRI
ncbi:MAG: cytochrome c biogenesis protein ResB [Nitrospirae bacterium]|nr:cytochrome c biogenesis protein ResB [Nitrospirota bacterium]